MEKYSENSVVKGDEISIGTKTIVCSRARPKGTPIYQVHPDAQVVHVTVILTEISINSHRGGGAHPVTVYLAAKKHTINNHTRRHEVCPIPHAAVVLKCYPI